jgi:hemolysin activation/secretion protein
VFVSPIPALADLVLAARGVVSVQTSGTPFFAMNTLAFTDMDRQGLGGRWTLRGYNQDRFVGPVAVVGNVELRWTFVAFDFLRQNFGLAAVPFLDVGRVFDRVGDLSLADWKRGAGAGVHLAWNKATIIAFDYGLSTEGRDFYMAFGQQF